MHLKREYTPDDLLTMPDGERYELVDGMLVERHRETCVEKPMGLLSDIVASRLAARLDQHCTPGNLGWVMMPHSGGFQIGRQVRKPDAAFVAAGRFPGDQIPTGNANLAPDLVVEVSSPNDLYDDVEVKAEEYLRAGVRLVWVVSPVARIVRVHRANRSSATVREADQLEGEDVVPGFRCPLRDLFPAVAGASAP